MIEASIALCLPSAAFFGYAVWRARHRIPWRAIVFTALWAAFVVLFGWFAAGIVAH